MEDEYDVVIIGSGIAGSLVAWKLALAGARVVILEAGDHGPEDVSGDELRSRLKKVGQWSLATEKTPSSPYSGTRADVKAPRPAGANTNDPYYDYDQNGASQAYKSNYERLVGGSTWHWLGNVPRLLPNDFKMRSRYGVGVDWPISYDDLEGYYVAAERIIGVSGDHEKWDGVLGAYRSQPFPMQKVWQSYGDLVISSRLAGKSVRGVPLDILPTPQARNSEPFDNRPACAGNSICVPICPIQAKYDATVHLKKAMTKQLGDPLTRTVAELRTRAVVSKLEAGADGRVTNIHYVEWSADKSVEDKQKTVQGRIVVLAANAIESAKLLLISGLANRSDQVGRNLMDHLQGEGGAILPEPVYPFRGPPTTSGIDVFRDGHFRSDEAAFRMSLGNDGWGRLEGPYETLSNLIRAEGYFGPELKRRVGDRTTRMFRISYSTEQLPDPENRVTLSSKLDGIGIVRPKISYRIDDYNRRGFRTARLTVQQIFDYLEAEEVKIRYPDDKGYSGAGHVMGTCRMGSDPRQSVVDAECRAHEHSNLFLVGASVFPTCGTANPTLTVAALAIRAANEIQHQLKSD